MLLQKGIHIGQVADALVIALNVVEQKLQLIHQAHRVLVGGLEGLVEVVGIFAGIFQSGVGSVDVAVVLPDPVRGQVVEQIDDLDGIVGNGDIFLKGAPLVLELQPACVPQLADQQMSLP